ncbi:hypothetical protein MSG28_003061 [Choristoneura fumiferana]|uniref:Uncharacterized protein n=1 Tax=Choristoneura fumiferana TaxID=7141 RepID=A0ACC0JKG4_CHOFU|nr:hypothetical protein MSG28_003061 [Choristoneura fumiferana]
MDRLTQLRGGAGGSRDASMDGSAAGDSFLTASDTPSKYYSLSEDDSFDIAKDVSLATATAPPALNDDCLISNLSPIGKKDILDYKIGKQIEAANILSGGVDIFDDNENSYDGNELVIDDNVEIDDKSPSLKSPESSDLAFPKGDDHISESTLIEDIGGSKETEVVLQIDGKNVDAINIGNGLYLYRKEGQEELAAVQIIDDDQHQPSFKFLKVRENAEGNLEVYEEIEIEVPKEVPVKEGKPVARNTAHVPIKDINKVISDPGSSKVVDKMISLPENEAPMVTPKKQDNDSNKDEVNVNGKMVKISESRKSPLMAYHSTPNKEGIPLTKTMVDQKLHPSRHSDNNKKTIEVHTDSCKQKNFDTAIKSKEIASPEISADSIEIHKPTDKKLPLKDETSEITKETRLDLSNIENKSIEVIDVIGGNKNDETVNVAKEPVKPDVIQVKDTVIDEPKPAAAEIKLSSDDNKDQEKEEKAIILSPSLVSTDLLPNDKKVNEKEEKSEKIDITLKPSSVEFSDESHKGLNEPTVAMGEAQQVKKVVKYSQHDVKGITESLSNDVKNSENNQPQKSEVIIPEEIIEVDEIDADENNLIIEEVIVTPPNEPESNKMDVKEPPSAESKNVTEDQLKIEESNADVKIPESKNEKVQIKPAISTEITEKVVEKPESKDLAKEETLPTTTKKPIEPLETSKQLDSKQDNSNKLKTEDASLDNIQLNDASKTNTVQLAPNKYKSTEILCTKANKGLTKVETVGMKTHIANVLVKTSEGTVDEKSAKSLTETQVSLQNPETGSSKLDSIPNKNNKNTDSSVAQDAKVAKSITVSDKESSLAPNKEQSQTNLPKNTQNLVKPIVIKLDVKPATEKKSEINHKTDLAKQSTVDVKPKSINNNHAPVPFGKWTEANRQDFLNKIKESKVPVNTSNANQLKQPNDLNRRDVLKKIDSQRQTYNASVKVQESLQKGNVKTETAFSTKTVTKPDSKVPVKSGEPVVKPKPILNKKPIQAELTVQKIQSESSATVSSTTKQENQRKEINNQDLIDKTIEGIINRAVTGKTSEDVKPTVPDPVVTETSDRKPEYDNTQPTLLDAIEMKMNELHGIPFVERPPHELPRPYTTDSKASTKLDSLNVPQKSSKIPNLLPLTKSQQKLKDCEDDIVNHEATRDKKSVSSNVSSKSTEKLVADPVQKTETIVKKDNIITEKEFDKFVRRNSITYENCLTVTDTHQAIQTVAPRSVPPKKISRNEQMLAEAKAKSPHKHPAVRQYPSKGASKHVSATDAQNKQYHSKLQLAYQTALTAKRHIDSPITIIEDKPVKVVYLDSNAEFLPATLDVAGRDLSPARPLDVLTTGTGDSLDSDMLDAIDEIKSQEETKAKTKHQRKQVLTPVETPDLELIEPGDLGIEVSPKKKRRIEDRPEKSLKNLVPKKSYLLGRSTPRVETASDAPAKILPATIQPSPIAPPVHNDPASAIDNLVKAAELLENQAETLKVSAPSPNVDSPQSTPVKRGRGRPRKNPLPEGSPNTSTVKVPSPQKKPRLARDTSSDDESTDDEALIKENWTMGKINENIVCPICNKLFRSENVVFKHVKHCTGPSPSRSGSSKRSPRRSRPSRDSDTRATLDNDDDDSSPVPVRTPRKRKSNDSNTKSTSSDDVIPVETDPKQSEIEETKKSRKSIKPKTIPKTSLVCEICGKSFRQLSYLVSHKLQHKKEEPKRPGGDAHPADKSVFGCETCKKEFRKLHHLVQHRLIHNPVPSRALRKTSSEQKDLPKSQEASKVEDQSAGFRCEPCDKSFRKLHHLVEHRETHDGINRQRSNSVTQVNPEKPTSPPQCDICKKTFRKLHHLIEHKDQHLETSSEKSDDQKSVKSSLSTKDIIHECNLCYMVFPNEHSLTKHTVICLRKKRQSAAKQAAALEEKDKSCEESANTTQPEEQKVEVIDEPQPLETPVVEEKIEEPKEKSPAPSAKLEAPQIKDDPPVIEETKKPTFTVDKQLNEPKVLPEKKASPLPQIPTPKISSKTPEAPAKVKQVDEVIVIEDTPKKRVSLKNKLAHKLTPSVTKRQKAAAPTRNAEEQAPAMSSSDDDEVRYMFNPDFKLDEIAEGSKNFMKVRAKKRSSLQIERPKSKDLVRRRSLLQHPPKIPRLRAKSDDTKSVTNNPPLPKSTIKPKLEKIEQVPSTDSDDSDVKYSFPKTVPETLAPTVKEEPAGDEKKRRKTIVEKRRSLSGIAKRKSLGKAIVKPQPPPAKPVKRRK